MALHAVMSTDRVAGPTAAPRKRLNRRVALVADDHALFRAGAAAMLTRRCGYDAVLQAGSLGAAVMILENEPAISLACFDLCMPGIGDPAIFKEIRERFPAVRLVVLTGSEAREHILMALQAGVHGYVPKSLPMSEIVRALRKVGDGEIYVPHQLAQVSFDGEERIDLPASRDLPVPSSLTGSAATADLTKRQEEILRLICLQKSNKEIGLVLGLSQNTVKVHTYALYQKLGVHTRQQAAAIGAELLVWQDRPRSGSLSVSAVAQSS